MAATSDTDDVDDAIGLAEKLAETGVLGPKQAEVYALREVYGVRRQPAADVLDVSPNTVDRHLADARDNVQGAQNLLEILDVAGGE